MKRLAVAVLAVSLMFLSCDTRMKWLDVVQEELTLIYDDNCTMTAAEKQVNKEAGMVTCIFFYETPENRGLNISVDGDDCISVPSRVESSVIQVTPVKKGEAKLKVAADDSAYGFDTVHIRVINKSEL